MLWKFASPEEFYPVYELFKSSNLGDGAFETSRRITTPLYLRQLITFYENSKLCGFVSFAFLNEDAARRMPETGINNNDWRSGKDFWVIDFAASKGISGYKMLRIITKALAIKQAKYFRHKHKQIREVRA